MKMVIYMNENLKMDLQKEREDYKMKMVRYIKEILKVIIKKEKEYFI